MLVQKLTRAFLGAAALLFGASICLVLFRPPAPSAPEPERCESHREPGDVWVRWLEADGRAAATPAVRLGKEAHRLVRRATEGGLGAGASAAHTVATIDGLWPCFCGRAEQLWKQDSLPLLDALAPGGRWVLAMDEYFPAPPPIEVALGHDPSAAPHEIALPGAGALVVKLWPLGLPVASELRAEVIVRPEVENPARPGDALRFALAQGETRRLPEILVGQRFVIEYHAAGGALAERLEIEGPSRAGEERAVHLVFGERTPICLLRAADERGAAIEGRELRALWIGDDGIRREARTRTQSRGHAFFSLDLPTGAERRGRLLLEAGDALQRGLRYTTLPRTGAHDLGAIELSYLAAEVSGRVVERFGDELRAVPHAEISLSTHGDAWRSSSAPKVATTRILRCDARGFFGWREDGDPASAPACFSLVARDGERCSRLHFAPAGAREEVLVLERSGELRGRVLTPPGLARFATLRLTPELDGIGRSGLAFAATATPAGEFRFARLPPGRFRLEIALREPRPWVLDVPALHFAGVEVRAGESGVDERFAAIDLRDPFTEFRFELSARGAPLRAIECDVFARHAGTSERFRELSCAECRGTAISCSLPRGAYEFRFEHPEFRTELRKALELGEEVVFRHPRELSPHIDLAEPHTWPRDLEIEIVLVSEKRLARETWRELERSFELSWRGFALSAKALERLDQGRYRCRVPLPDELELRWVVPATRTHPARHGRASFALASRREPQVFRVELE